MVKYYKKVTVDKDWIQPVLTANGVIGADNTDVMAIARISTGGTEYGNPYNATDSAGFNQQHLNGGLIIDFKKPIYIRSLTFSGASIWSMPYKWTLYVSNDNTNYTSIGQFSAVPCIINLPQKYRYIKMIVNNAWTNGAHYFWGVANLKITGMSSTVAWQECTRDEYDQLPDDDRKIVTNIYSIFSVNKFYKLAEVEKDYIQPTANYGLSGDLAISGGNTDNPYGNILQNNPLNQSSVHNAFNGGSSNLAQYTNGQNPQFQWVWAIGTSPIPTLTHITFSTNFTGYMRGSHDRVNWVDIPNTNFSSGSHNIKLNTQYKFYLIQAQTVNGGNSTNWGLYFYDDVTNVRLYGTYTTQAWQPCTKEEYNQLPDNLRKQERCLYASKSNNKAYLGSRVALMHKVIKDVPWEQPYLTSNGTYGVDELATVTINTNYDTGAFQPFGSGSVTYRSWDNVMYWRFSTKKAIKITKFTINTSCSSGTLYGSKTNADGSWVTLGTWSGTGGHDHVTPAAINNITVDDYFNYFQIAGVSATFASGYGYFNHFDTARVTATYKTEVLVPQ